MDRPSGDQRGDTKNAISGQSSRSSPVSRSRIVKAREKRRSADPLSPDGDASAKPVFEPADQLLHVPVLVVGRDADVGRGGTRDFLILIGCDDTGGHRGRLRERIEEVVDRRQRDGGPRIVAGGVGPLTGSSQKRPYCASMSVSGPAAQVSRRFCICSGNLAVDSASGATSGPALPLTAWFHLAVANPSNRRFFDAALVSLTKSRGSDVVVRGSPALRGRVENANGRCTFL